MKNKYLLSLIFSISLISCKTVPSYYGVKYELPYDENATLTEVTPKEMFNMSCIDMKDSVFLIGGLESCSGCVTAKEDTEKYIFMNHCVIYYIDINNVTFSESYDDLTIDFPDTDYYHLYHASIYVDEVSNPQYALPHPKDANKNLSLPVMYFFKYGGVGLKIQDGFVDALRMYIHVS